MTGHTLATGCAATLIKLAFAAGAKLSAAFIAIGLTALVPRNLPNEAWPHRICDVLGKELINRYSNSMFLIFTPKSQDGDAYKRALGQRRITLFALTDWLRSLVVVTESRQYKAKFKVGCGIVVKRVAGCSVLKTLLKF
jgi:hypothetical protein